TKATADRTAPPRPGTKSAAPGSVVYRRPDSPRPGGPGTGSPNTTPRRATATRSPPVEWRARTPRTPHRRPPERPSRRAEDDAPDARRTDRAAPAPDHLPPGTAGR